LPSVPPLPVPPPLPTSSQSHLPIDKNNKTEKTDNANITPSNVIDKNDTNITSKNDDVYLNNHDECNDSTNISQQSGSLLSGRSTIREPKKRAPRVLAPSNNG
jgi:hypothetical protein